MKGIAYILHKDGTYETQPFTLRSKTIKVEGFKYKVDKTKILFWRHWTRRYRILPKLVATPILIYLEGIETPIDIDYAHHMQEYKKIDPLTLKLIAEQRLESSFFSGLISGRPSKLNLKWLLGIFAVITVALVIINTLYPGLITRLLTGRFR